MIARKNIVFESFVLFMNIYPKKATYTGFILGWEKDGQLIDKASYDLLPCKTVSAQLFPDADIGCSHIFSDELRLREIFHTDNLSAILRHPDVKNATSGGKFQVRFSLEGTRAIDVFPNGTRAANGAITGWRRLQDQRYSVPSSRLVSSTLSSLLTLRT